MLTSGKKGHEHEYHLAPKYYFLIIFFAYVEERKEIEET
jgi:hypothetical protein